MGYQLPRETKTNKFESLPDDLKSVAEELIAKKFGIEEVMEGEINSDRDFLGQSPLYNSNLMRGELISRSGQRYSFMAQLSTMMDWGNHSRGSTSSSFNSSSEYLARFIQETVKRYVSEFERKFNDYVEYIRVEINGRAQELNSYRDIQELAHRVTKPRGWTQTTSGTTTRSGWYTTNYNSNWNYS